MHKYSLKPSSRLSRLPLFKVHMPKKAVRAATKALRSGYIGEGPVTASFEKKLATWLNEEHVAVLDSCTSALSLALHLAGVHKGAEVISSPLTCAAANTAILRQGGVIRWADVDHRTGNMSAVSVEERISSRTVAVLFNDWGGVPADATGRIQAIAHQYGARTIEDAASGLGSRSRDRPLSASADFVCYSFQAIKQLTTINGGALVTREEGGIARARLLRWYGLPRSTGQISMAQNVDLVEAGYKMHLNDVSSAIGIAQLDHIDAVLSKHRTNAEALRSVISKARHFQPQIVEPLAFPSYHFLTVLADKPANRVVLAKMCEANNIETSIVHRRNDVYTAFLPYSEDLPGVDSFSNCALAVPCGWWLTAHDVRRVSKAIRDADESAH